ncbi:MAG TPA: efflux RND transporter periplasmic adaptor subunit [Ideonella sp.]|uniref:efflux RND transporter periplasmic adaptor subunit n=1 Tax=Ideonella sp. TaxID=1929293 RepID=UPI002C9D3614|nr:efflux RND transporter periplasmic adaptor subunit [Ideonella sp.]HSI47342.1 efflux RND transporter periplasmic adaptor subunit [Ideonella sp.]
MQTQRVAAMLAALALLGLAACSKQEVPPEPVRAVRTMKVSDDNTRSSRDYAAEIRPRTESQLGFRVGGKLQSRPVNLGDTVRAGQVLAQLDPQDLQLGQASAQAALLAAQSSFIQADADLKRYRELRAKGFIGEAELERHDLAQKTAQAQLDQAKAQMSVQRNQTGYASLVADSAGVITAVSAEPGQVLAAGAPVVRLAHDGPRDAVFNVPEDRIGDFRALIGKTGSVTLQPWGGNEATPVTIHEVAAAADSTTRTFQVKADIGSAPLRLGQTATIRVSGGDRAGVIRLPLSALIELKGQSAVWLLDAAAGTVRQQVVSVSGADGNTVVVTGGLKAGDEVVTAGTHMLNPGQKVRRYVEPAPASAPAMTPAPAASH